MSMNTPKDSEKPESGVRSSDLVRKSARDKSVRDLPVEACLKVGQIIVEQRICGVVFSFPAVVWPEGSWKQAQWVERLTPWWDTDTIGWTPQCQRLRDACRGAINKLLHVAALPENRERPAADGLNVRRRYMPSNTERSHGANDPEP